MCNKSSFVIEGALESLPPNLRQPDYSHRSVETVIEDVYVWAASPQHSLNLCLTVLTQNTLTYLLMRWLEIPYLLAYFRLFLDSCWRCNFGIGRPQLNPNYCNCNVYYLLIYLLHVVMWGRRAFLVFGATVWNDLPLHVASVPSLAVFRRLKTFVFPFLPRHYHMTCLLLSPFITTIVWTPVVLAIINII